MDRFMRESDAFTWYLEGDPVLRSIVVAAQWLDSAPDWDYLVERVDRATASVPGFRQRLLEPPARLAVPRWAGDPEFDLSWHLRRMAAPLPRDDSVVLDVARKDAMTGFDQVRPLWQFTLIEGLEGGRAALVMKMHHSLTDGVGAMELAFRLFDRDRDPGPLTDEPPPPGERLGTLDVIREHAGFRLAQSAGLAGRALRGAYPTAVGTLRHPWSRARQATAMAASVGRTVAPLFDTRSPIMKGRGLGRQLGFVEVGLSELQAASRAAGGTINDGFVAAVAGGLRIYHERHGAPVDNLRLMMPINLRMPGDPAGGNRITLMRLEVPVGQKDVAGRVLEIGRRCRAVRHEMSLPHTNAIAGGLNLLPPSVVGSIFKHVDFIASNVPGFDQPIYLAGAKVDREVAFGPTTGTAVNLTLVSYCGTCTVGVTADTAAIPDLDLLVECLRAGFDEILAAGAKRRPVKVGAGQPQEP
ncbi:MAG TPA: wax ester/triacylglycerol synthase domain-containing protein [Acidimicrobiales bacterium]|nr:wax ester/triacylglycerol synthase domain-containing protein [Acidimicrobiales bacterium]